MLNPEELPPLNSAEFASIFDRAIEAGAGQIKIPDPSKLSLEVAEEDGSVTRIGLTDSPINRMGVAIRQEYGADSEMFQNIMFRILALMKALHHPETMEAMVEECEDSEGAMVHPAVIEAAALLPLNEEGDFEIQELLREAEKIAEEKYPDLT